ncbi:MAG: hypothetical protein IPJ88_12505 [Myxococcales bacterium]|nr:MAG: hypothetical protein IPJ88_12505 [Myxococcales bacterium]
MASFEKAEESENLNRTDLIALLEGKALVYFATDDEENFKRMLVQLASVHRNHAFEKSVPPEVNAAFDEVLSHSPGRLSVQVQRETIFGGELLRGVVKNDVGQLVRNLKLYIRKRGRSNWQEGNETMRVLAPRGEDVEFYAIAKGPGGVDLVSLGTPEFPKRFKIGEVTSASLQPTQNKEQDSELLWFGLGAGAAALIAGSIALILYLSRSSDNTQPSIPALGTP